MILYNFELHKFSMCYLVRNQQITGSNAVGSIGEKLVINIQASYYKS